MFKILYLLLFLYIGIYSNFSYSKNYNFCSRDPHRNIQDDMCPRMEGVTPKGCCPTGFLTTPLSCVYSNFVRQGQVVYSNSSYRVCNYDNNGDLESIDNVPCCRQGYNSCYNNPKTLSFYPRLIHRDQCCLEKCPDVAYWLTPPVPAQASGLTQNYRLTAPTCTSAINNCSASHSATCQTSQSCSFPRPPSPPGGGGGGTSPPSSPPSSPPVSPPVSPPPSSPPVGQPPSS